MTMERYIKTTEFRIKIKKKETTTTKSLMVLFLSKSWYQCSSVSGHHSN